jgi:3-hydroxyisobutyrate/3-hydroxypropionate dehydrogenase
MSIATDPSVRYGFIGIGQMGWGMAMNLRQKIPKDAKMVICEISESRRNQFIQEVESRGAVTVANTPREVAEQSVSRSPQTAEAPDCIGPCIPRSLAHRA